MMCWFIRLSLGLCLCFSTISAKYVDGYLRTAENWAFLSRFCFLSEYGQFEYTIEYNNEFSVQNILLYYDADNHWPQVYKSKKTCEEKESVLNIQNNQIVNLTVSKNGCRLLNKTQTINCHSSKRFHSARERWWFLAISNCNSSKGLSLKYTFVMTNGPPGDYWHQHFSADEFYILPALMCFFILYMLLIFAIVMCTIELKSRQLLHSTYTLFFTSVVLQELGVFIQCIAYIRYAINGIGLPKTKDLGIICESASEIIFVLVLLLLAKGYTVTRGRLRLGSSVKLTVFMCLYVFFYCCLFLYEKEYFDPGEVLYTYESLAGYGLIGLRVTAWWMFIYSTVFTLKHYPEKSSFYYHFNLIGTLWFVTGPIFILCANAFIDKWVRESVVCAVQHIITATGHVLFLMLTVPNKANKNFPYHVRTTQIGVMEVTDGTLGTNTLDYFGHHTYAPGGVPLQKMLNRNYSHWDYNHDEMISASNAMHNRTPLNILAENSKGLPQDSVSAISNGYNSDYLIARPEDIPRVPDFTAPSHKNLVYSPN